MPPATRRDLEATGIILGVVLSLGLLLGAWWAGVQFVEGYREASVARAIGGPR